MDDILVTLSYIGIACGALAAIGALFLSLREPDKAGQHRRTAAVMTVIALLSVSNLLW